MRVSDNELAFLAALRDNDFSTLSQVAQHCGFTRQMTYHYYRSLSLGGLIEGLQPSYAGYKLLDDEPLEPEDFDERFGIRHESVPKGGHRFPKDPLDML